MENKICQSCGMPIKSVKQLGKNKDGSNNEDYCRYCFDSGMFIDNVSMNEYIEMCSKYGAQAGMTNEEMKEHCTKLFPTLKRWQCTRTNECASSYNPNCSCPNLECHCKEK
ncbi:MAG: zinc ribbon domain-containing protein [Bacilli bacterium]|nr:zinc ribbon domain-containing protein [Bacilli bacterium]